MFKGHFYQLKPGWWIVSDTHFGHKNIIKYSRPEFTPDIEHIDQDDLDTMHESMIKEWNSIVKPEDKVIHLGDVALGMEKSKLTKIIGRLNGTKMLLPGNHDRGLIKKDRHYFNDVGFKNVEVGVTQIETQNIKMVNNIMTGNDVEVWETIILSHEPIDHVPKGCVNIHGHVHGGMTEELYGIDSRRINVCWDAIKEGV